MSIVKSGLRALLNLFEPTDPIKMAVSSFEGSDSGPGTYLIEKFPPSDLSDSEIGTEIGKLQTNENELNRNVGAAIRDAITKLEPYKDQGGSILYLVTASQSQSSELELDIVENLIKNNIQLVAVEAGGGTHNALQRFSLLSHGEYFPTESDGSSSFFTPANRLVASLASQDPLIIDRQIVILDSSFDIFQKINEINSGSSWSGSFQVASDLGTDTVVAFHSPLEGLFTLSINGPDGSSNTLTNGPTSTNWNDPVATVGLAFVTVSNVRGNYFSL